jgi:hypothetical protein
MSNKITWLNRYSQDDKPDKFNRWARVGYFNNITVAWIKMVKGNTGVKYVASPFFPTIANDSPFEHLVFDTEKGAKEYIEWKWKIFIEKISSNLA